MSIVNSQDYQSVNEEHVTTTNWQYLQLQLLSLFKLQDESKENYLHK